MKREHFKGYAGLRTFAISMVIACHVGFLAPSSGGIGNKIFFTLSGFLAYFSLLNIDNIRGIIPYWWRKIIRIIPAFYILIILVAIAFPQCISAMNFTTENSLILNMFFVKSYAHLWFLQQIMLMYLVSPLFMYLVKLISYVMVKDKIHSQHMDIKLAGSKIVSAALIFMIAVLEKRYFTSEVFSLSGTNNHGQFAIWMFLLGFSCALVYDACRQVKVLHLFFSNKAMSIVANGYVISFIAVMLIMVVPSVHDRYIGIAVLLESESLRSILSCIAIFLLAVTPDNFLKKILDNRLFQLISDCSFEIYIIHFFIIPCFTGLASWRLFVAVYVFSLCVGYCVHRVVHQISFS